MDMTRQRKKGLSWHKDTESTWEYDRKMKHSNQQTIGMCKNIKRGLKPNDLDEKGQPGQPQHEARPGFLHLSDSLLHVEVLAEIGIPQPRSDLEFMEGSL